MKRNEKTNLSITLVAVAVLVGGALFYWRNYMTSPGQLDSFAKCLGDRGAKFYGAYWCPHCQAQKALFGKSKDKLPYIECADSAKAQSDACAAAGIQGYPTWIFADNSSTTGEQTLEFLAQKTNCPLPAGVSTQSVQADNSSPVATTTTQ